MAGQVEEFKIGLRQMGIELDDRFHEADLGLFTLELDHPPEASVATKGENAEPGGISLPELLEHHADEGGVPL